jgi:peroxiredoxin
MKAYRYLVVACVAVLVLACAGCATVGGSSVPDEATFVEPVSVGDRLPPMMLTTADGRRFDLNAAVAQGPAVIVFYRGGWCKYCRSHLADLNNIELQLKGLGYNVFAISADRPGKLMETAREEVPTFTLLSDSSMDAARAMGVAFRVDDETFQKYKQDYGIDIEADSGQTHHQLPVPSVFIVGKEGMVRYAYVNPDYKVRLAPQVLVDVATDVAGEK